MFAGDRLGQDRRQLEALGRLATASASFHGTITVAVVAASGTPGLDGIPWVASPEPASASSPSTWPW